MKFKEFGGSSWKEVTSFPHPWKPGVNLTLRNLVILAHNAEVDQLVMTEDLMGCRYFAKGFAQLLIEGLCFELNMSHEKLGWEPPSQPNEVPSHSSLAVGTTNGYVFWNPLRFPWKDESWLHLREISLQISGPALQSLRH